MAAILGIFLLMFLVISGRSIPAGNPGLPEKLWYGGNDGLVLLMSWAYYFVHYHLPASLSKFAEYHHSHHKGRNVLRYLQSMRMLRSAVGEDMMIFRLHVGCRVKFCSLVRNTSGRWHVILRMWLMGPMLDGSRAMVCLHIYAPHCVVGTIKQCCYLSVNLSIH